MDKFIYIRGSCAAGTGDTDQLFSQLIPNLITYSVDYADPVTALNNLLALIDTKEKADVVYIIASADGGYFAELVANRRKLNVVLYNPCLDVSIMEQLTTSLPLGYHNSLLSLDVAPMGMYSNRSIVLCIDDCVASPESTLLYLSTCSNYSVTWSNGGHDMTATNAELLVGLLDVMRQ